MVMVYDYKYNYKGNDVLLVNKYNTRGILINILIIALLYNNRCLFQENNNNYDITVDDE